MFRIFGPPGTGKTTTLLNMVDEALENGTSPHRIAFLAFTRKAANEAKERAAERFGLDPKKDLVHFRTLHSLALTMTDIRPEQVMQEDNYKELSKKMGISLGGAKNTSFDDDVPSMVCAASMPTATKTRPVSSQWLWPSSLEYRFRKTWHAGSTTVPEPGHHSQPDPTIRI